MEEHKKHHYVPKCYLKQFTYAKDRITHIYNKTLDKCYQLNISDICFENHLYSLSEDYLQTQSNTSLNPLSIEMDFFAGSIEKKYNELLKWIQKESKSIYETGSPYFKLTDESKKSIAQYIVVQYLRTPFIRDIVVLEEQRLEEKMLRLFKQGLATEVHNPSIMELDFDLKIDRVSYHALNTYIDESYVDRIANHLAKSYWHFYYSPKEEFYSSDNPVVIIHRHKVSSVGKDYGLTDYGAEIMFPINPSLLLTIYDYQYFSVKYKGTDGLFAEAVKKHINYANVCQIVFSKNIVFNKSNDFAVVSQYKTAVKH